MSTVRYEVLERVAEITLDSPPVNALSVEMINEILAALRRAAADDSVRAVIIASALPRRFCAGLDLGILQGESGLARKFLEKLYVELADVQYNLGKPSIVAIDGAARAGESSSFGYPEIDIGLIPAIHFIHLPRIIGRHRAFEILFSGRSFSAAEAASLGLVSRVVADGQVLAEARTMAKMFASKPPGAMKLGHAAYMRFNDLDYRRDIGHVVESFCNAAAGADAQEGISAFIEKRAPNWR